MSDRNSAIPSVVLMALRLKPREQAIFALRQIEAMPTFDPDVRFAAKVALRHMLPKPAAEAEDGR